MLSQLPLPLALPRPPLAANGVPLSPALRAWLDDSVARWDRELVRALEDELRNLIQLMNAIVTMLNGNTSAGAMLFQVPLTGTMDNVNTSFDLTFTPGTDANGVPQVLLLWKTGPQLYSTTNPPPPLQWTLVPPTTVILGQPPAPGDSLVAYGIPA